MSIKLQKCFAICLKTSFSNSEHNFVSYFEITMRFVATFSARLCNLVLLTVGQFRRCWLEHNTSEIFFMSQIEFFLGFGIHQLNSLYLVIRNRLIPSRTVMLVSLFYNISIFFNLATRWCWFIYCKSIIKWNIYIKTLLTYLFFYFTTLLLNYLFTYLLTYLLTFPSFIPFRSLPSFLTMVSVGQTQILTLR